LPISVNLQAYIFLYSIAGGMIIALIYDIFRIKRKAIKTNAIITYIEDLIYWIIVALVMLAVVYYSNEGEIRGYIFIGTGLGVILYVSLLSRIVIRSSMIIIGIVSRILRAAWIAATYPIVLIYRVLRVPCLALYRAFKKACRTARRAGRNRFAKAALWGRALKNIRKKI